MPTEERLQWLRIMTLGRANSERKHFQLNYVQSLAPLFQGAEMTTPCDLTSLLKRLKTLVEDGFLRIHEELNTVPPLYAASKSVKKEGCNFFVPYAERPSHPNGNSRSLGLALRTSVSASSLNTVRYHSDSSMDRTIFEVLGVVCHCPVLVFDPICAATCRGNGDYYAGKHGINQQLLEDLGLPHESFFTSQHRERTLVVFSDNWGKVPLNPIFKTSMFTEPRTLDSEHQSSDSSGVRGVV